MLNTQRPLTIEDAEAISHLPYIIDSISERVGTSEVEANDRVRNTMVVGWGPGMLEVMSLTLQSGQFLPVDDQISPRALAVIGSTIEEDLYPGKSALGDRIRIGGSRYRIVGVLAPKGPMMGMNPDESVIIPTARAMELYNANTLMDIMVRYREDAPVNEVVANIRRLLLARHGLEDFTILTQQQMMEVLDNILGVMTMAVAALGSISLFVGGVGIFTIMTIAVRERTQEIGLLRSVGSTRQQIQQLFLAESVVLASMGGVLGLVLGGGLVLFLGSVFENLPVRLSLPYVIAAELVSVAIGLIAGVVPASAAAKLDPLEALRAE